MELEKIAIFIAVAESESFTEAAKQHYKSHSTMSRAVSALEHELGVILIERESNKFKRLTPAGVLLYNEGRQLIKLENELSEKIKAVSDN